MRAEKTAGSGRPSKRERTRRQLVAAALRLFARQDAQATSLLELAEEADVAHGTVYNYFRTREEMSDAVAAEVANQLSEHVTALSVEIADPAQRVAIGVRTFVRQALVAPDVARVFLRLSSFSPRLERPLATNVLRDLRRGRRDGRFRFESEVAALDLVIGATTAAMRSVVAGKARPGHDREIARLVLCGLGMDARAAERVADLPVPDHAATEARAARVTRSRPSAFER